MKRDPFYREISLRLAGGLDPDLFEACICDLLRPEFPSLVPVRGGSDSGMDGAIADGEGVAYPLVCTTASDVIGNLDRNLRSYLEGGGRRRKVVVATSRSLSARRKRNLEDKAGEHGFQLVQVFDKEAIADRLYQSPKWCLELLELTGNAPTLSAIPRTTRPLTEHELTGREADLSWLRDSGGDLVLVGQPGSGKTSILYKLACEGMGLFVVGEDLSRVAGEVREKRPSHLYLDDAHVDPGRVVRLVQIRRDLGASFSIVATVWPGGRDEVIAGLGAPGHRVRELELLTRVQIVQVLQSIGLVGSTALIREIVDQARGLPGLAVTLAELCRQEGVRELTLGSALKRSVHLFLKNLVGEMALEVLACFSIGGNGGMNCEVVARVLEITTLKLRRIVAGLEASGVVTDLGEGVLAVYPVALRYALVRDLFYSGSVRLDPEPLTRTVHSPGDVAQTLIGVRAGGGSLTDDQLWAWVDRSGLDIIWMQYANLGRKEVFRVLREKPDRLLAIASVALPLAPDEVILHLLRAALNDPRELDQDPQHPMRILSNWIREARPGQAEALGNRATLLKGVLGWLERGGDPNLGLRVFLISYDPSFQWTEADAGAGRTISLISGYLPPHELKVLEESWSDNFASMPMPAEDSWGICLNFLHGWAHPMPPNGPRTDYFGQVDVAMKRVAVQMIQGFARIASERPGVLHVLNEKALGLGVELTLDLDPEYAIIYPPRERLSDDWQAVEARQGEEATRLGERWSTRDPGEVAARLAALASEARVAGHSYPDHSTTVCRVIASATDRPLDWIKALEGLDCNGVQVDPFLRSLVEFGNPEWPTVASEYLGHPRWMHLVAQLVLSNPEHSLEVVPLVLRKLDARWSQLVYIMSLRNQLPERVQLQLLSHDDGVIAGSAAVGAWCSNPKGVIPEPLLEAWRGAILGCTTCAGEDYWLGQVLRANPELACEWFSVNPSRVLDSARDLQFLAEATSGLTTAMRVHLLELVSPATWRGDVVSIIIGSDLEAYRHLLGRPDWKWMHPEPISWPDRPDRGFSSPDLGELRVAKARLAMSAGYSAEEVAAAIFFGPGPSWIDDSRNWQEWLEKFQELRKSDDPATKRLGEAGVKAAEEKRDEAYQEERRRAVFGGW